MELFRVVQTVVAFGLLVFVHELGHFLAAKWAGVRVEVFSFGFGPFLLSFRRGETTYALSLIPLGGYVRMTGQADIGRVKEADKTPEYSYMAKSPRRRAVIIVAGVVMNVVFAYFVFVIAQMAGRPEPPAVVGEVIEGMPAATAGFQVGDRIVEVGGKRVHNFNGFKYRIITAKPGEAIEVKVKRTDVAEPVTLSVTPEYDEDARISLIGVVRPFERFELRIGAASSGRLGVKGLSRGPYPARSAGLKAYDVILAVNGEEFRGLKAFKELLRLYGGTEIEFDVLRGEERLTLKATPALSGQKPDGEPNYILGILTTDLIVGDVLPGSPAEAAGLRTGDFVHKVVTWPDTNEMKIAWRRPDGSSGSARATQLADGPVLGVEYSEKREMVKSSFGAAFVDGAKECVRSVRTTYDTLLKLIGLRVSPKHMSGVVGIATIVYQSTESGLGYYLWWMAFISVNLAILNMLPMMPLDGGLLVFLAYEGARGRPASPRVQEAMQIAGLVLILALVIYVTSNDIARFFS